MSCSERIYKSRDFCKTLQLKIMKTQNLLFIFLATTLGISSSLVLSGCASDISPNTYDRSEIGQASKTAQAKVVSMMPVAINTNTGVGGLAGAAAGAAAGSTIGGDTATNIVGGIGGAVVGGLVGNAVESGISKKQGMEYVLRTKDGSLVTVTQAQDLNLRISQPVLIIYGKPVRVVPDNT